MTKIKIKDTGVVNMGKKLPLETMRALLKLASAMGPKITPITKGAIGYSISVKNELAIFYRFNKYSFSKIGLCFIWWMFKMQVTILSPNVSFNLS